MTLGFQEMWGGGYIFIHIYRYTCFPCGSACNAGDLGLIPGLGRSPGEGKGYLLQYSGLENPMDCRAHGVVNSQTRLSSFHYQYYYTYTYTHIENVYIYVYSHV